MSPASPGIDNPLYYDPKTLMLFGDAKDSVVKLVAGRQGALNASSRSSPAATSRRLCRPSGAVEAVREAFVAYARGEWPMPPKVYVPAYPAGDFRAMPALGGGHALLKWVTSFPATRPGGLPTVSGLVLLSDASNGSLSPCSTRARSRRCGPGPPRSSPPRRSAARMPRPRRSSAPA